MHQVCLSIYAIASLWFRCCVHQMFMAKLAVHMKLLSCYNAIIGTRHTHVHCICMICCYNVSIGTWHTHVFVNMFIPCISLYLTSRNPTSLYWQIIGTSKFDNFTKQIYKLKKHNKTKTHKFYKKGDKLSGHNMDIKYSKIQYGNTKLTWSLIVQIVKLSKFRQQLIQRP